MLNISFFFQNRTETHLNRFRNSIPLLKSEGSCFIKSFDLDKSLGDENPILSFTDGIQAGIQHNLFIHHTKLSKWARVEYVHSNAQFVCVLNCICCRLFIYFIRTK